MAKDEEYEVVDYAATLPEQIDSKVKAMTRQAEEDLAEIRVNFRWGKAQLALVKSVADAMGIPYQTYMKQVVYRQALLDKAAIEGTTRIGYLTPSSLGHADRQVGQSVAESSDVHTYLAAEQSQTD